MLGLSLNLYLFVHDVIENKLTISLVDNSDRAGLVKELATFELVFYTDGFLRTEYKTEGNTINTIIRNTER